MAIQSTFSVSKELGTADLVYTEDSAQFGLWVEALDFAAGEFARLAKLAPLT